jgi:hypothetical protein
MFGHRFLSIAATTAIVASFAVAGSASADTTGQVGVTGTTVPVLQLTLPDASAGFGSNLDPIGTTPNGEAVLSGTSSGVGACYEWAGAVKIDANDTYTVTVAATEAGTNGDLHFLASNPATYAACTGGTAFAAVDPISFVTNGTVGYQNNHDFWLGLPVVWSQLHNADAAKATIVFSVQSAS